MIMILPTVTKKIGSSSFHDRIIFPYFAMFMMMMMMTDYKVLLNKWADKNAIVVTSMLTILI